MGNVIANLSVMPESPDYELDDLEEEITEELAEGATVEDTDTEDVAFGLQALILLVSLPDAEGGTDAIEDAIGELDAVESVRTESVTRE